ncbi:MAG: isochorismatase family protein [Erysipelotrichaceae bacterium]|nr:isochorismatase family protein [Erysipelotrichaceae bacterium]
MQTALLIIDVQQDLLDRVTYKKAELIDTIKQLEQAAIDSAVPLVMIRHDDGKGTPMQKGSPGFQIAKEIAVPAAAVFDKTVNSSLWQPGLKEWLEDHKIRNVIVGGMQSEFCVHATIVDLARLGYQVIVVKGATHTLDNPWMDALKTVDYFEQHIWKDRYAKLLTLEETLALMASDGLKENS